MNARIDSLSPSDIRDLTRSHAELFAAWLDNLPCGHKLSYDDAVAVAARVMVEHAPVFCEIVRMGTGASEAEVQATPWPQIVKTGCEVIEATREAWRPAWPNGFLQAIVRDELHPFSSFVRGVAR